MNDTLTLPFRKPLPVEFTENGFVHRQIKRRGMLAIYERTKGASVHFEVIRIGAHDGRKITDPKTGKTTEIAPAETYPTANQWGSLGWTYPDEDRARAKFSELEAALQ